MYNKVLICLVFLIYLNYAFGKDTYTNKYDNIDVEQILHNERILKRYMDCIMDRGPCTAEAVELKKNIPDALTSECSKCTEIQKKRAGQIMAFLLQNKRHYWEELLAKYDKDGKFRKHYEEESEDEDYSSFYNEKGK